MDINSSEFDYIICGGGTAGCVVAFRLAADPKIRVLLLEAGKSNEDLINTHMAGGWTQNFDGPDDWNISTTPQANCNDRTVKLSRGKYLGGCTGCNGTLCVRGTKQDYDSWNIPGWSGDDMWRCMNKAEHFHGKEWFKESEMDHGFTGPVHTEPHDPAPITIKMLESFESAGLPFKDDLFSTGETAKGCGHVVRTVHAGVRSISADFLKERGGNLVVLTEVLVDKINLENNGLEEEWTAKSVHAILTSGENVTLKATKEVIVSAGAYCSPAILMRSGIGDGSELRAIGIEPKVQLPGVGKNLLDHLIVFMFYEVSTPGLTNDHLIYPEGAYQRSLAEWRTRKSGFLSTFPFGAFAYTRLDDFWASQTSNAESTSDLDPMGLSPAQPNIEYFTTEAYGGPKQFTDLPMNGESVFSIIPELFSPRSKGKVTLARKDPSDIPIVDHNYLADPMDLEVLAEGCRIANEIVLQGSGTKDIVAGSWPRGSIHHKLTSREYWKPFVREHATTCYHAAGTCKMGGEGDAYAVVDEKLKVRGVTNLRVADTSIMPTLNQGHTQMPAYAIGEKCAEMVKEF